MAQQQTPLTVSAAMSDQCHAIKILYQRSNRNVNITYNFGAGATATIEQGPVDVFFLNQTNGCFAAKNLLLPETRRNLLTNRLILITPNAPALASFRNLTDSEVRRIAIGNRSVPAGQYAQNCSLI